MVSIPAARIDSAEGPCSGRSSAASARSRSLMFSSRWSASKMLMSAILPERQLMRAGAPERENPGPHGLLSVLWSAWPGADPATEDGQQSAGHDDDDRHAQ